VASCHIGKYDAVAPEVFQSANLMPGARGLVVAGSAGPELWRQFRAHMDVNRARWDEPHPLDGFVAGILAAADTALAATGIRFRRFEAAFHATPRLDFVVMARLVGLGSPGPFGVLIHAEHGAWWALRGAWLLEADVEGPLEHHPPCIGCHAPCIGGSTTEGRGVPAAPLARATPQARALCVIGQHSRYDEDQIAYHYHRAETVLRLKGG
jgi:hypothetical protein